MSYAIIDKTGYVRNTVVCAEGVEPAVNDGEMAVALKIPGAAGIGDWYEAKEGVFYQPRGIPDDMPEEIAVVSPYYETEDNKQ